MISTSKLRVLPASGWLKSMVTWLSSKALTTPGSSALAASLKITSRPSESSMSLNWLRGMVCTFCGLGWPKPCSGSTCTVRLSPALKPNRADSKPGNRLPSPTLKVAGCLSKVLSTTSPFSSLRAKCRVTSLSGPIRSS
ncbi:hypothetical protein D3C80_1764860 [compost metagenome]